MWGQGVPVTSKPLKYIVAPTDSDFCNITLAGIGEYQVEGREQQGRAGGVDGPCVWR